MNIQTGASTACFYPLETELSLDILLDMGCKHFEVFINALSELESQFLNRLSHCARKSGANFVSLHPFTSPIEGMLLFGDYPRRTTEGYDFYKRYFEAAAILGAQYVILHGQRVATVKRTPSGNSADDSIYWEHYAKLYQIAKGFGVLPAQENVVAHRSADPAFIAEMRRYLDGQCAFTLDVKQCRASSVAVEDMVNAMGENLVHIHLSDGGHDTICRLPGKGIFDHSTFLSLLQKINYSGFIIVEVYRKSFLSLPQMRQSLRFTADTYRSKRDLI